MHVIIVDDNASNRALCEMLLRDVADEITTLQDGQVLVDTLPKLRTLPDVILLDVIMPVKNGFEAANEVRALFPQHHIPIIFLTALDDDMSFEQCLSLGDDFVLKPVEGSVVRAKVQAHYRIAKMHREVKHQRDKLKKYRQHVEYEHSVTESIFENLKNEMSVQLECISGIDYLSTSKTLFNGDLIIAARRPHGGAYIMVADATGHGLPAAISTLPAARAFFAMTQKGMSLGEIVDELNSVMARFLPTGMMLAANVFEVKSDGFEIAYWAGGLPESYLLNSNGTIAHTISSKHMPLGVLSQTEFEVNIEVIKAAPEQKLCCYTDGVIEAKNNSGYFYGEERLKKVLCTQPIEIQSIYESVRHFSNKSVDDDLSILIMNFPLVSEIKNTETVSGTAGRLPCEITVHFDSIALKELNVMVEVRGVLQGHIVGEHLDLLCTILSELILNAIDHGLLELYSGIKDESDGFLLYYQKQQQKLKQLSDDKWMNLKVDIRPLYQEVYIELEHNGAGFEYKSGEAEQVELGSYGRGLSIVESLCESVEYTKSGRCVQVVYLCENP